MGPEEGQKKEVKILSRIIRWTNEGLEYEADQRHADLLVKEMKVTESKEVTTPIVSQNIEKEEEDLEFDSHGATQYRSIAARVNYIASDRPDLQFACKVLTKICQNQRQKVGRS